jgi:hypothetical protein
MPLNVTVPIGGLPTCDQCHERPARVDIQTIYGPWGNFCLQCAPEVSSCELGMGRGQLLVVAEDFSAEGRRRLLDGFAIADAVAPIEDS